LDSSRGEQDIGEWERTRAAAVPRKKDSEILIPRAEFSKVKKTKPSNIWVKTMVSWKDWIETQPYIACNPLLFEVGSIPDRFLGK